MCKFCPAGGELPWPSIESGSSQKVWSQYEQHQHSLNLLDMQVLQTHRDQLVGEGPTVWVLKSPPGDSDAC